MSLRPGDLLGLPDGFPSATLDAGWCRVVLVALAVAAGWAFARGRTRLALAAAVAWALFSAGFWSLALARPYGVLQEPAITAWAAEVGVAAAGADGGFLAGEPPERPRWSAFARRAGARATLLLPTVVAIAALPVLAALITLLGGRTHGALAAILWLAASTIELDVGRGTALALALLGRPAVGVAVAAALAGAVVLGRLVPHGALAALAVAAVAIAAARRPHGAGLALSDLPGALVLDLLPWLALAVAGAAIRRDPAASGLAAGGAVGLVLATAGVVDAVTASALYRAGLVLAAVPAVVAGAERLAGIAVPLTAARTWRPTAHGLLALVAAVAMAGGFLTWWDPTRLDPAARASLEPIGGGAAEAAAWIRATTDPGAAFVAAEDYAPAVSVLAGRRVLRAPTLAAPADDVRRLRVERAILLGRAPAAQVGRYRLRYLLVAAGQFRHQGLPEPWPAEAAFPLRYDARGIRIYEITAGPDGHVDVDVDGTSPTQ